MASNSRRKSDSSASRRTNNPAARSENARSRSLPASAGPSGAQQRDVSRQQRAAQQQQRIARQQPAAATAKQHHAASASAQRGARSQQGASVQRQHSETPRSQRAAAPAASRAGASADSRTVAPSVSRAASNKQQREAKRRRKRRVLAIVIALLVVIVGGSAALMFTGVLKIKTLSFSGTTRFTQDYLVSLADISPNSTYLTVDIKGIEERLEASPWIEDAEVRRVFPNSVAVTIDEADVAGVIEVQSSSAAIANARWLISSEGVWLSKVSEDLVDEILRDIEAEKKAAEERAAEIEKKKAEAEKNSDTAADVTQPDADTAGTAQPEDGAADGNTAPAEPEKPAPEERSVCVNVNITLDELESFVVITEIPRGIEAEEGAVATDPTVLNALAVLSGISKDLRASVVSVAAASVETTALLLDNNVSIVFGAAEDIDAKEKVIEELLASHDGTISYINVTVVSHPTYRALE